MNWFKRIFSKLSEFFMQAAQTAIGVAADSISSTAIEVVSKLDANHSLSGAAKRDIAIGTIKEKYPNIQTAAINLAIESAVAIVKELAKR